MSIAFDVALVHGSACRVPRPNGGLSVPIQDIEAPKEAVTAEYLAKWRHDKTYIRPRQCCTVSSQPGQGYARHISLRVEERQSRLLAV